MGFFLVPKKALYLSPKKRQFYSAFYLSFSKDFFLVYRGAFIEQIKTTVLTVC